MIIKKIFLLLLSTVLLVSFSFVNVIDNKISLQSSLYLINNSKCKYRQCSAVAKSTGNRCKHCVSKKYDYYCWQHQ